jgi:hypothetical protein
LVGRVVCRIALPKEMRMNPPKLPEARLEPETVVVTETVIVVETPVETATTGAADDAAPVVFTPDDVTIPPPDRPPTEEAPESEKVGLIFERS